MSNDINEKLKDYLNQSVNDYLRERYMNSNGTWATDAEMIVTASLLGIDIVDIQRLLTVWSGSGIPPPSAMNAPVTLQSTSKTFQNTLILLLVYSNKYCLYTWHPECPSKASFYCIYCN